MEKINSIKPVNSLEHLWYRVEQWLCQLVTEQTHWSPAGVSANSLLLAKERNEMKQADVER